MTNRFWDDAIFGVPGGALAQPVTVTQLLMRLDVAKSSRSIQESAIAEWLDHNVPNVNLQQSMTDAGFRKRGPIQAS